jgi:excisionase family DNA binding protein
MNVVKRPLSQAIQSQDPIPNKRALTEAEAAEYISVGRSTLRKARMTGALEGRLEMPPFVKFGRSVRYLIDDLDAWLTSRRVNHSAQKRA